MFVGGQDDLPPPAPPVRPQVEESKVEVPEPTPPVQAPVITTAAKIEQEQERKPRVKKQWKRNEEITPKVVEDLSQERKAWQKPVEIPETPIEVPQTEKEPEPENFEVVHVDQVSPTPSFKIQPS